MRNCQYSFECILKILLFSKRKIYLNYNYAFSSSFFKTRDSTITRKSEKNRHLKRYLESKFFIEKISTICKIVLQMLLFNLFSIALSEKVSILFSVFLFVFKTLQKKEYEQQVSAFFLNIFFSRHFFCTVRILSREGDNLFSCTITIGWIDVLSNHSY